MRVPKDDFLVRQSLHRERPFVHQTMVATTEQHEVVEARLAAVGPMDDVVRIDPLVVVTTREATTSVALAQREVERRGYGSGLPADVERPSPTFDKRLERGVTAEPPHSPVGDARAALD